MIPRFPSMYNLKVKTLQLVRGCAKRHNLCNLRPHILHNYAKDVQKIFAVISNILYIITIFCGTFVANTKVFRPVGTS
jgi:hypothetical protein